jgi:hypothetical protein
VIEGALQAAAEGASLAIKGVAVVLVTWGSIEAAVGCIALVARRQTGQGARKVVSPEWIDIAQLGASR